MAPLDRCFARAKLSHRVPGGEPQPCRIADVPTHALLQINGSLARAAIKDLVQKGVIRVVAKSSHQEIYTRATNTDAA